MLQGSTLDVLEGHQMASTVKSKIIARRNEDNEFDKVYGNMLGMAERADDEEAIVANDLYKFNSNDLPFPQAFLQEIALWKTMWNNSPIKPNSLVTTIADRNAFPTMFPTIIELLSTIDLCNIKWSGKS
ncbi:hypothetical protein EMCRGX_G007005 [Ephydatia muelleri]